MMAYWRLRNPDDFPPGFHEGLRKGVGAEKVIWAGFTRTGAEKAQMDWRLFRFCLRSYPHHPLYAAERDLRHRTRVSWNRASNRWELLLTSRKSVFEELISMR